MMRPSQGPINRVGEGRHGAMPVDEALRAQALKGYRDPRLSRPVLVSWVLVAGVPVDGTDVNYWDIAHEQDLTAALGLMDLRTLPAIGLLERHPERNLFRRPPDTPPLMMGRRGQ